MLGRLALQRLASTGGARALASSRPLTALSRLGLGSATRSSSRPQQQQRQTACSAAEVTSTSSSDKMAAANGAGVTAEEVEELRKQLETLQVRPRRRTCPCVAAAAAAACTPPWAATGAQPSGTLRLPRSPRRRR